MPLLPAAPAPLETPFANPANPANLTGALPGEALEPAGYFAGTASGTSLSYPDVADFVWFDLFTFSWDEIVSGSRIRSSFEVTLGRTLVGTPQADVSASETFPRAEALNVGDMIAYPTMIRPTRPIALLRAIEDGGGLPVYEQRLSYETRLAALSRMYPPSLFATTLEAIGTATATAQEVLQHLFDAWFASPITLVSGVSYLICTRHVSGSIRPMRYAAKSKFTISSLVTYNASHVQNTTGYPAQHSTSQIWGVLGRQCAHARADPRRAMGVQHAHAHGHLERLPNH